MALYFVEKASATGDHVIEDAMILIEEEFPKFESLEEAAEAHGEQARYLENALYRHLPGGTYDRLLGAMMERRAPHFRGSHTHRED